MKKTPQQFQKFEKKKSNAAIKEQFRQEKRAWKKEASRKFEERKQSGSRQSSSPTAGQSGNWQSSAGGRKSSDSKKPAPSNQQQGSLMPLNKFIAHAGICGRREAAEMVKKGLVKVNGELITEPGHKVNDQDDIKVNGKKIYQAKALVYILLNKPKDYITTTDDPQNRKTVLDLVQRATKERIYPVGRLDRNTSGVLLLTNDGELAQKLSHPANEIKKVYHVSLNKPLEKKDFDQVLKGVSLEDGLATVDSLGFPDKNDKTQIGVEIHSGRNRIVRRIFESLGYDVRNLDRVIFPGLTKKNVNRGRWRHLTEREVRDLKYH